jgi:FtsP/CotA-like multicopper oxidase with cupredoxin domain
MIDAVTDAPVKPPAVPERLCEIVPIDISHAVEMTLELTGEKHIWTLVYNSQFAHPLHLHGYFFQVLDDKRIPEWKDTVNVPVNSSVPIAIDFDERLGMWMFPCHILNHAEVGMMGRLHVEPAQ